MRCFTIAAVVAVSTVALTQIASAADLPRKAPAYIPLSPPILSWTGWYAGLNAGGMWSNQDVDTVSTSTLAAPGLNPASGPAAAAAGSTSIPANSSGFIGGGQIGYNWQFMPQWVAGLEADIQGISRGNGTDAVSQAVVVPNSGGDFWTATTNVSSRLDYLGTGRGRVGYLVIADAARFWHRRCCLWRDQAADRHIVGLHLGRKRVCCFKCIFWRRHGLGDAVRLDGWRGS